MKKCMIIAFALAALSGCKSQSTSVPGIDLTNLDTTINLQDDFYQYATGGWQAKNPLKPEFSRYGSFDVLREQNEIRLNELFADIRARGKIGIPCIEREDGSITFEWDEFLK